MTFVKAMKDKVFSGDAINREEALRLVNEDFHELCNAADEIRKHFCGDKFDLCTIVNGKCGKCSEDCKYCAQSAHYQTSSKESYPLLSTEELLAGARHNKEQGVFRYSIVTSGRALSDQEVEQVCESIRVIRKEVGIEVCVSFGLMTKEQFCKIREAGATRVHCNLESSKRYFQQVCTTHTYQDKLDVIQAAKDAGLSICSGGILGLGESMEDRIDLALTLRELGIKSVPVNVLNPIQGTPYEHNEILSNEMVCRVIAVFRFLLPDAHIRLAGGRGLLGDQGKQCFQSGANAAISGDMLTTAGITTSTDLKLLATLGYQPALCD